MSRIEVSRIRDRIRAAEGVGYDSACSEYQCECHRQMPAVLEELEYLRGVLLRNRIDSMSAIKERVVPSFRPDWTAVWTVEVAELSLTDFKFVGPGVYRHRGDTFFVVPLERTADTFWVQKSSPGERFEFSCFEGRDPGPVFNLIIRAPERTP
jgi:hypothetical protein